MRIQYKKCRQDRNAISHHQFAVIFRNANHKSDRNKCGEIEKPFSCTQTFYNTYHDQVKLIPKTQSIRASLNSAAGYNKYGHEKTLAVIMFTRQLNESSLKKNKRRMQKINGNSSKEDLVREQNGFAGQRKRRINPDKYEAYDTCA